MSNLKFDAICIDCANPERLARFYADLLGVETHGDHLFAYDGELKIWFQSVENYERPTWPTQERGQQIHFDLHTNDRETEVVRAVAMGASIADDDADDFTVMLDPEGHPFCICDARNSTWGSDVKS